MSEEEIVRINELDLEMINPSTHNYMNKDQGGSKIAVIGKPGCWAPGTLIMMHNGRNKKVEDVKVGDLVMGDDSTPRTVLELCQGQDDMVKIVPIKGEPYVVNMQHILTLKSAGYGKSMPKGKIIDIHVEDFLKRPKTFRESMKGFRVPIHYHEQLVPIDPYTLGCWMLEGIKDSTTSSNLEVRNYFINKYGNHRVTLPEDVLTSLNLHSKRIPDVYKYNSRGIRLELLAGFLDSCYGFYDTVNNIFDIAITSEKLLDDIIFLARTLGFAAYKASIMKNKKTSEVIHYRSYISGNLDMIPTKVERKRAKERKQIKDVLVTGISIEPVGPGQYYGFVLDGNQRLVMGDCTVTHNTGKCLGKGTPVLMHDGRIKKVEDIKVNELLMGDDSTPRKVLSTCKGMDDLYEVSQEFGDTYVVNSPHILSLVKEEEKRCKIDIPLCDYLSSSPSFKSKCKGYTVAIDFPYKHSEDPYEYGLKLANNPSKIPDEYKINSWAKRYELLEGIVDGWELGKGIENKEFQEDFKYLVKSLGYRYTPFEQGKSNVYKSQNGILSNIVITPLGKGEYYGFELDGNHRFLLGDFTVTHNTTLISAIMYAKKHIIPVAEIYSGTEDSNGFYRQLVPNTFIYNKYDEVRIGDFITRQKIAKEHLENPWAMLLIDDCTDEPAIFRKPLQQALYKNGRHWKMLYILSLQYCMDIRPGIRTNIDGCFILREPNLKNRESLYKNYAGIIPDFKIFCDILDQVTDDYTALYIHNSTTINDWKQCIFWFKAKPPPQGFKFGCPEYFQFHWERYNQDYVDPLV